MKKRYNNLALKTLNFFIKSPYESIHLREFSRRLKISLNSSQRFLNFLLGENLIKEERKANLRYFRANLDSIVFRKIKLVFSLKEIEEAGFINFLRDKFTNVVLFGSVAKGLDDLDSDLDMVCIGKTQKLDCSDFERKIGREINFHIFSLSEWKNQSNLNKAFYQDVIANGVSLIGEMPIL